MKAFYCVGTHWDREWYEPFQEFRIWLVELIDELMDLMERDPRYLSFHLDGQTIVPGTTCLMNGWFPGKALFAT